MRNYEALYIVAANLTEDQVSAIANRWKEVTEKLGGTVEEAGKWETRRLEFEIKNHRDGTYILMKFSGSPAIQHELKRQMMISDDILRLRIFLMEAV